MAAAGQRRKRDYYEVLGVPRDADEAAIKKAFRALAKQYHPDRNPGDKAAEDRFKECNEAYAVLSDAEARKRYDRFGAAGVAAPAGAAGFSSVVDAFDDLVGDLLRRRKQKKRGRDLRYTLEVTFEEAALGCEKTIRIPDPAAAPGGPTAEKAYTVKIPPGTTEGAVRMLHGEGEPGASGGAKGDLHVIVRVQEHPVFKREGNDVLCEVPITFTQAALGGVVDVPTLDGRVKMRVPEGTQSGRSFRIRGKGIPRSSAKGGPRGDHLVRVMVETPTGLNARQWQLLEQFAEASGDALAHPRKRGFLDQLRDRFKE
jgi:molecular chaperone DnaJ